MKQASTNKAGQDDLIGPWQRIATEPQGHYRVFDVRQDRSRSPRTGRTHTFYVIESPAWVNIIPLTPDGQIVFIRQYRHGTGEVTLEVPGGMVDPHDAAPADAARREMMEETGYDAETVVDLGSVAPNPAIQNNRCYTYLALDAWEAGPQRLEGAEEVEVVLVDPADVPHLVMSGQISHALVVVAFYLFDQYRAAHPELFQHLRHDFGGANRS